jgi:hypothetical protein
MLGREWNPLANAARIGLIGVAVPTSFFQAVGDYLRDSIYANSVAGSHTLIR